MLSKTAIKLAIKYSNNNKYRKLGGGGKGERWEGGIIDVRYRNNR